MNKKIITLTSYGPRLRETAPKAIRSLITPTFAPDKIILYVAEADRQYVGGQFHGLPVEIKYVEDIKSHKKFMGLADRDLDGDYIIIVDDDLQYKPYFFAKLWNKYEEHTSQGETNFIVVNRAQLLLNHTSYFKNRFILKNDPDTGVFRWGSGGGVLVPPYTMRITRETLREGYKIAPHCDETFYSCFCAAHNIGTICTGKPQAFYPLPLPKRAPLGLWETFNKYEKDSILIKCLEYFGLDDNSVRVSFTSWTPRIKYAAAVVDKMRRQTIKPKQIILTLSVEEFPNKEKDLPRELLAMQGEDFVIRWSDGNTRTFKKVEPLFYLPANDWVAIIDDDVNYPPDFIAMMLSSVKGDNPVTGSHLKTNYQQYGNILSANGAFTLIKPKHCLPYLKGLQKYAQEHARPDICSDPALTYSVLLTSRQFTPSKKNLYTLQVQGNGRYPEPYSRGREGVERNQASHKIINEFICTLKK